MAYSSTNPPVQVWQQFGGRLAEWAYYSTETVATVAGAGFFTDGFTRGMRVGHSIYVAQISTGSTYIAHSRGVVTLSSASTAPSATVSFAATTT
jgi:uncharacterized membrane protein YoaT (DUF817 family)